MEQNAPKSKQWLKRLWLNVKDRLNAIRNRLKLFWHNLTHKETRKKAYRTIIVWFKKNSLILAVVSLTYQTFVERSWRREAEIDSAVTAKENARLEGENSSLRKEVASRNEIMDNFDWPWYKKTKLSGWSFRLSGMNIGYEKFYGLDRLASLGKTNFELVPYEAAKVFHAADSTVIANWKAMDLIEPWFLPDSTKISLFTHKWPGTKGRDTILYGVSVPLSKFIKVIDEKGNLEVITIISDTTANAVQDTIMTK